MVRVIRAYEGRRMRWANGCGFTTELFVHPLDAGFTDFDWRISRARMVEDGPFSTMAGIDRTLAVVGGNGMALTVGAGLARRLDASSAPFGFRADMPASARLLSGPASNLNIMTRRGRFAHTAERLRLNGGVTLSTTGLTVVYLTGAVAAGTVDLAEGDVIMVDGPARDLHLEGRGADAIVIRLRQART